MIEIPTAYERLDTVDMRSRRPGRASEWRKLLRYVNRHFAHAGHHFGGIVYPTPFQTLDSPYTSLPLNAVRPLNTWAAAGHLERKTAAETVDFTVVAVCKYMEGRVRLYNEALSSLLATLTFTAGSGIAELQVVSAQAAYADTLDGAGNPAPLKAILDVGSVDPEGTIAELYIAHVWEGVIDQVALLPVG